MNATLEPRRIVSLEEGGNVVDMEVYLEVELENRVFALLVPADLDVELVEMLMLSMLGSFSANCCLS